MAMQQFVVGKILKA